MIQRPRPGEQEGELLQQDCNMRKSGADGQSDVRPQSRFAKSRKKKSKNELVDHTVLQEAVARSSVRAAVMGRVVERTVGDQQAPVSWPRHEPLGNPKSFRIPYETYESQPGKSLYRQYLEKQGVSLHSSATDTSCTAAATDAAPVASNNSNQPTQSTGAITSTGPVLSGVGGVLPGGETEAAEIHRENLQRLAQLSYDQIQREREDILRQCDPNLIQFLKSLREKRTSSSSGAGEAGLRVGGDGTREAMEVDSCTTESESAAVGRDSAHQGEEAEPNTGDNNRSVQADVAVDGCSVPADASANASADAPADVSVDALDAIADELADAATDAPAVSTEDDEADLKESDLPIPPSEAKKWVNMDKVELDKLRWTTSLPPVKPLKHRDQQYTARFSLTGELLPYDADVDYREALHHHGQEPGRAGYSLDELFVLARSAVLQQRHLALTTLAAILSNLAHGHFHSCFQAPLLQMLLDSGLVLLLRFSLDDSAPMVRVAGVSALAALLASEAVEGGLAAAHPWAGGHRPGVASAMHAQEEVRTELQSEESELKDSELLQLDVIRALLRVDTLVRIRYLVDHLSPPAECVLHIISVLTRISAHSLAAAWKVVSTTGLLQGLLRRYLPHDTSSLLTGENVLQMTSVEGVPLPHMLRLIKVLCSWGKHLSLELVTKHDLLSRLQSYAALVPTEVALPLAEVLRLSVEVYSVWDTLLGYGLQQAQDAFRSFFPLVIRQLHFYRDKVALNEDTGSNQLNFDLGANLVHLLCRAVSVAATQELLETQLSQHSRLSGGLDAAGSHEGQLQVPLITWSNVEPVIDIVRLCCSKWLVQLQRADTTFSGLRLLGSTCIFVENYFRKWKDQRNYSAPKFLSEIEDFYNNSLAPLLASASFAKLLSKTKSHSALCSGLESSAKEDAKNLATLNTIALGGKVTPILLPSSPFPLLLPLSSLLLSLHELHPALPAGPTLAFTEHAAVLDYLTALTQRDLALRSQWFTRIEARFLVNIIQVTTLKSTSHSLLYHRAALVTMPCLQKGQEHLAKALLTNVICCEKSVQDMTELSTQVGSVGLNDYEPLKSPALFKPCLAPLQLTKKLLSDLSSIGAQLATSLFETQALKQSAVWIKEIPFLITSVTIPHSESPNIFDDYWPLLPLKKMMLERIIKTTIANEKANKAEPLNAAADVEEPESDQSKPEVIVEVARCIQLSYLCLRYRHKTVMIGSNVTGWLRYLSLTFLVASDLFLDHTVSSYLQGCLRELLLDGGYKHFNDSLELPGFGNTFDWYKKLIEQYNAVSYGDSTFALMLLLPSQQRCPIAFRSLLWGDLSDALPLIRLSTEDVSRFMPVTEFEQPAEQDEEMLHKYKSAAVSGLISPARTPLLWHLALHHSSQQKEAGNGAADQAED